MVWNTIFDPDSPISGKIQEKKEILAIPKLYTLQAAIYKQTQKVNFLTTFRK